MTEFQSENSVIWHSLELAEGGRVSSGCWCFYCSSKRLCVKSVLENHSQVIRKQSFGHILKIKRHLDKSLRTHMINIGLIVINVFIRSKFH